MRRREHDLGQAPAIVHLGGDLLLAWLGQARDQHRLRDRHLTLPQRVRDLGDSGLADGLRAGDGTRRDV